MQVAKGIEMLSLEIEAFGHRATFHPTLIWDQDTAILVDTGMPGQFVQIRKALEEAGVSFDALKGIILTHQDLDHIGSLPDILRDSEIPLMVYAHPLDTPYIQGERPLIKTDTSRMSKEAVDALPPQVRDLYDNPPKGNVTTPVEDGEVLTLCGGIQILHTPGHTPGHISLYLKESKVLIAGDAMTSDNGILRGPVQQTTPDMETALASLAKFKDLNIEAIICYHGGLVRENIQEQLEKLLTR